MTLSRYHIESPGGETAPLDMKKYLTFDPAKVTQHSFASLGLPACELGDICVTDPFPLFSVEAVETMRAEIFRKDTLASSLVSNDDPAYTRCVFLPTYEAPALSMVPSERRQAGSLTHFQAQMSFEVMPKRVPLITPSGPVRFPSATHHRCEVSS